MINGFEPCLFGELRSNLGFSVPHFDDGFAIVTRGEVEIHLWAASDEKWKASSAALSWGPIISGAESF